MILRPGLEDLKIIGLYTGKIIKGIGLLMLIPMATAVAFVEWNAAMDFLIGIGVCFLFGLSMDLLCATKRDLGWSHGLVVASFSWLVATVLGAIPHWLSGHFGSYLDAMFDIMSGYTTTGLYLIQDLDHVSYSLNMWRHVLTFAGGQGIIVIALTFLFRGTTGAYKMYVGEGKDERLLPNVVQTARAIWTVSLTYCLVGTSALWIMGMILGQGPVRGFLHALWVFMGSWSTGGFAPQSYNAVYYHSLAYEIICTVIFIAGSFNFALHWAIWTGKRSEIRKNIEIRSFFITVTVCILIVTFGLMQLGVYPDVIAQFRKMFYQVASAHTTTGLSTIYSRTFVRQWGPLAMLGITMAMAIGASACSTGGGFKGIRVGIIAKSLIQEVRRMIYPESARVVVKWHHITSRVLTESVVRSAMLIVLSYIFIYVIGALIGVCFGYDFIQALFESVSAGSNTGLSCGVTTPSMPEVMKIYYVFSMWAGRLEFMSVFALAGFISSMVRGK
ncbi:MAG: TrkH family potassium uptake protein [Spirochaetaceae bacterium]|nr:MAG: TrkH family potassium uptake protein [Spirochaetaceae bacterium]